MADSKRSSDGIERAGAAPRRRGRGAWHQALALLGATALLLTASGCERLAREYGESQEKQGDAHAAKGEYAEAILAYEAALSGEPESADTHLKIGLLYDEKLDDPVSAAHHFQRYLTLAPEGRRRGDVEAFIKEDQLKLITRLGHGAILPQQSAARIKNENIRLEEQVQKLRAELEDMSKERARMLKAMGVSDKKAASSRQVKKPLVPGVRTHVVKPGENLGIISRKYYGREANWKRIQDANFAPMTGTATLQSGMELMIP